ncbi:biotin/lipoyl-binding protein [Cyanobium sp. BA20m-p-22]|uniref:efflux RND transporter periplasmic adaptor subunit n=1 Tax=Cyanobium sp. BA20m-p-22 TaxID=2823704 RepID=UPI0020CC3F6C|nr:biotin/lipoyl-binding protein [Cyanobium sp. BA20m-p-22]MCP9908934.1 biotin/lipoyl-binding protein [Cyanobium sp. BA20m-p-22]
MPLSIRNTYMGCAEKLRLMPFLHKRMAVLATVVVALSGIFTLNRFLLAGVSNGYSKDCLVAKKLDLQEYLNLSGLVSPSISVNLTSEQTGRVSQLLVREGSSVKMGQIVALFDSHDIDARIQNKRQELYALRQRMIRLQKRAERAFLLSKNGIMPISDTEDAEAQVFESRADLARSESELLVLEREQFSKVIVSPLNGTVAQIFAFPGTFVSPMTSASDSDQSTKSTIMQIYGTLQVIINSPESLVLDIVNSVNIVVSPTTDPKVLVPAKVERSMPYVVMTSDKVSAIPIRLDISDSRPFLPGMNVDISIAKAPVSGVGVRTYSLVKQQGRDGILSCDSSLTFRDVDVLGEANGISVVRTSKLIKEGFRYSTVGKPPSKPLGVLDFLGKNGFDKIKELNPLR